MGALGSLVGHVVSGSVYFLLGLWHLFDHIKLHASNPSSYHSWPWFPFPLVRHAELYLLMSMSMMFMSTAIFLAPGAYPTLEPDWSIPSPELLACIHGLLPVSLLFCSQGVHRAVIALAFAQELLLLHFHSSDHMEVEGQYHWLLQLVLFVTVVTTLLSIPYPESFLVTFVRSFSLAFKGVWSIDIACRGHEELSRAKSLVNLQFMLFYVGLLKKYGEKVGYVGLEQEEEEEVPKKARVKLEFCANWERAAKKLCWKDKKGWKICV
ncbi:hypothetical protein AMTRI_Chr04g180830 [Amborella trichopoda]